LFAAVIRASLPVAFGYIPLGMAFGVLMTGLHFGWWWSPAMSLVIYAGSAQFLAVGLLSAGAGPVEAGVAVLLLNLRHVFYGLAVRDRYRTLGAARTYAVFGLTDETFSLLAGLGPQPRDRAFVLGVTAVNQFWWVLGSVLGALIGPNLPFSTQGLAFALTALFAVLLIEQLGKNARWPALAGAAASAALCLAVVPPGYFLITAISLSAVILVLLPAPREAV
jgi:4-azaleucine resistance transporter AzlC